MKSVMIVGMGRFGKALAKHMFELGNDVLIVDKDKDRIDVMQEECTSAVIGDCTKLSVIRDLGVRNFDICFVAIGDNLQNALEITSNMKELGAEYIICKASNEVHKKFLLMAGADEVILPENDVAKNIAVRCSGNNIFECIELSDEYAIFEMPVHYSWIGKSIVEIDIRKRININILGVKNDGEHMIMLTGEYIFKEGDRIIMLATPQDAIKLSNKN